MLRKLKHKLIGICIISTTLITTVITLIALSFAEQQLNTQSQLTLANNLLSIIEHLQNQVFSYSWLAQMETNNKMVIHISNSSTSLSFPGSYIIDSERNELITLAETTAKEYTSPSLIHSSNDFYRSPNTNFNMYTNKKHYLCLITTTTLKDTNYQILLIEDMVDYDQQILQMRSFFVSLIILGSIVLGAFSFWFVAQAIKPVELSHKEQTEFVASASHELRSPLAVIRTSIDELIEDKSTQDNRFVHIIDKECNQLTRLVNDLLFLARTDSAHWQITTHPVEPDTLLLDIYDSLFPLVQNQQHSIELILPDTKQQPLCIDAERITQAISILVQNALSYTPVNTCIILSLENIKNYIRISIIDHGPGISDTAKAHIFKRFYRVDPARHETQHYGLGLSIAYEIIKLHQGKLSVSDTPGGGATFTILLPSKSFLGPQA